MALPCLDHAHLTLIKSSNTGRVDEHRRRQKDQFSTEKMRMSNLSPDKPATPVRSSRTIIKPTLAIPPSTEAWKPPAKQTKSSPKPMSPAQSEAKLRVMMRHDIRKCPAVAPLSPMTPRQASVGSRYEPLLLFFVFFGFSVLIDIVITLQTES